MLDSTIAKRLAERFPTLNADPSLRALILDRGQFGKLPQGIEICGEGVQCQNLALVLSGSARIFKLAESGREITLYRVEPGECCILTASCILSDRTFPAFAATESRTETILLPSRQIRDWMADQPTWRSFLWEAISLRLTEVISLIEEIAFRRLDERVAEYLLSKCDSSSLVRATHQQIATELGSSREVVSRILKDFEAREIVALARREIQILDSSSLKARS